MADSVNAVLLKALAQIRSSDEKVQNEAVETIIGMGASVTPSLLPLLEEPDAGLRARVMYALSQIAQSEAAEVFQRGLQDADERVRAYAADGLVRLGHPEGLAACLRTLNDAPDELHSDMTPAVSALGRLGWQAIPELLGVLMDEKEETRLHAQRALELIVNQRHGFQAGGGFPTAQAEEQARAEWRAAGNYDYAADAPTRAAAVTQWRRWYDRQQQTP